MLILERINEVLNFPLVGSLKKMKGKPIFVTISPNPRTKHTMKRTHLGKTYNDKVAYGTLPQHKQFDYCMKVIKEVYNYSEDTYICGTWELNKDGNVHVHFILIDPHINTDVDLMIFQRDVFNTPSAQFNLAKKGGRQKPVDWMNNIVFITKPLQEVIDYMLKDADKCIKVFPYYKLHKKSVCLSEASLSIK